MARNTKKDNTHEFTKQINSTRRTGTVFANMENWDEKKAKFDNHKVKCSGCRFFNYDCSYYIGENHMPCDDFKED